MIDRFLRPSTALVLALSLALPAALHAAPPLRAAHARPVVADSRGLARATVDQVPVIDGAYVQAQLARLVGRDGPREAGRDMGLPPSVNGHDEFAADWLAELRATLAGLPLRVARQSFPLPGFRGRPPQRPGMNLIVTLPGASRPGEWVLLAAHYDGMPWSVESAYDDGSGCAVLLGVARALAPAWRRQRPARTIAFVLFDGEEQGLVGSAYVARAYAHGAPYRIAALYNEEQNGVGYPVRPFGQAAAPPLPEHLFVTGRDRGSRFAPPVSPRQRPAIDRFAAVLAAARDRAFARLRQTYPRLSLDGRTVPVFTPADARLAPVGDDIVGASDEAPFERLGLPTATFVGNYDYYTRGRAPWSYPFDTPRDTMALLERTASGAPAPSMSLAAALALPGQLTVEMLLGGGAWGEG